MRNAVFSIVLLKYINISIDLILSCLVLACLVLSGLVWSNFSHFIYIYIGLSKFVIRSSAQYYSEMNVDLTSDIQHGCHGSFSMDEPNSFNSLMGSFAKTEPLAACRISSGEQDSVSSLFHDVPGALKRVK